MSDCVQAARTDKQCLAAVACRALLPCISHLFPAAHLTQTALVGA